jgi:hypothetical protein
MLTDDRSRPEQPEQPLPSAVVAYRDKIISLYWDPERYVAWGDGDYALSAHTFIGACPVCRGELGVKFRERQAKCWVECRENGCERARQDEFYESFDSAFSE